MSTTASASAHSVIDSGLVIGMAQAIYEADYPNGLWMTEYEEVWTHYLATARVACAYATRNRTAFYATTVGPDDENFA